MFMLDLFSWWYGSGWSGVLRATRRRFGGLAEAFSIQTLLRTLFAPWKRVMSYPGASLSDRMRAMGDNLISRCVGFTARLFVLITAAVSILGLCVAAVLELIVWPLLPPAALGLILWGLL